MTAAARAERIADPTVRHESSARRSPSGCVRTMKNVQRRPGAASPRVAWRPNPDGAIRTLDEALAIGRRNGVDADDPLVRWRLARWLPRGYDACYGQSLAALRGDAMLTWASLAGGGVEYDAPIVVYVGAHVMGSDDRILAVLVHEYTEILDLPAAFVLARGRLTAEQVTRLIDPVVGTLHSRAWDAADEVVGRLQREGRWP